MARPKGDPHELLARIEAAKKVAKPRDVVGAEAMADIIGMSWRNLVDRYIDRDPQFPIKTRGSQGRGFEFEVVKVLRHMAKRCNEHKRQLDKEARDLARLMNIPVVDPKDGGSTTVGEMRQTVQLVGELQKLKVEQGELVPRAELDEFLHGYNDLVSQTLQGEAVRLDPTGAWPVEIRSAVEGAMTDVIVRLQQRLGAFMESLNGNSAPQPGGTGRRAAGSGRR